jgi:hypothetical protein
VREPKGSGFQAERSSKGTEVTGRKPRHDLILVQVARPIRSLLQRGFRCDERCGTRRVLLTGILRKEAQSADVFGHFCREFRMSSRHPRAPRSSFPRSQAATRPSNGFDCLGLDQHTSGAAGLQPCAEEPLCARAASKSNGRSSTARHAGENEG